MHYKYHAHHRDELARALVNSQYLSMLVVVLNALFEDAPAAVGFIRLVISHIVI